MCAYSSACQGNGAVQSGCVSRSGTINVSSKSRDRAGGAGDCLSCERGRCSSRRHNSRLDSRLDRNDRSDDVRCSSQRTVRDRGGTLGNRHRGRGVAGDGRVAGRLRRDWCDSHVGRERYSRIG